MQYRLFAFFSAAIIYTPRVALGAPTSASAQSPSGVVTLNKSDLAIYAPFTQFARAAYCPSSKLKKWTCGDACKANADFHVTHAGGDGNAIQNYFVGFSPSQHSIIVAHQGTDPSKLKSDLTDLNIAKGALNATLFPGVPSTGVEVHEGFRDEHARTAKPILKAVKKLIKARNVSNITVVGHSLGGALAELDSLFLALNLPSASVQAITYGTPRVGNPAFAQLVDAKVPGIKRINNMLDPVPIIPGKFLGFEHPHGEIHIISPGNAVACPGDDDSVDSQCTDESVPNIFEAKVADHTGPYEGISIGTQFCT